MDRDLGIPETVMRERCAGCAYRPGTEASRNPITQATAHLCLIASRPFTCHHGDGGSDEHLCRGWVDAFTVRMGKGPVPEWKRQAAGAFLATLDDLEDRAAAGVAFDLDAFTADLWRHIEALGFPMGDATRAPDALTPDTPAVENLR